jgi:hypothetical protein
MTTVVCNCKVQFIRPQYKNLQQWCTDTKNLYIGRAGVVFVDKQRFPKESSKWANPFKIGKDGDRDEVIKKYRKYIREKIASEPDHYSLEELRGKRLGCWCIEHGETTELDPLRCHGQVLLELLE